MSQQPALFDTQQQPEPHQRPAHIDANRCGSLTNYRYGCRCQPCRQAKKKHNAGYRTCKNCGNQFHLSDEGAGTKFCSAQCKTYLHPTPAKKKKPTRCPRCGTEETHTRKYPLCQACLKQLGAPTQALINHHVSIDLVLKFMANPTCATCGTDISGRIKTRDGKYRTAAAVDHDHDCCPSNTSCGKCVRGILCNPCNVAIGNAKNDPDLLRQLADYLDRHGRQEPQE